MVKKPAAPTKTSSTPEPRMPLEYVLGKLREPYYNQSTVAMQIFDPRYGHHFPYFTPSVARTMILDSRVKYGLNLIKGPISTYTKFFSQEDAESPTIHDAIVELNYFFPYGVFTENEELGEFVLRQLNRFWETGIYKALSALEWGYSASEVMYRKGKDDMVEFDNLRLIPGLDSSCVVRNRAIIGFVRNQNKRSYIPLGKGFWHLHNREQHHYYGESILKGSYVPWHELWTLGGGKDIRRTWYFKNAYDGGELYYPEGSYTDTNNQIVTHEEHAVRMMELKRSGSAIMFPSTKSLDGKREWEYNPPKANSTPQGLQEYIDQLRDEILEGMGIPPEVVQSAGSQGMGSATGRMIPLMAFIATLTPIGTNLINDFLTQIMPVLLSLNKAKLGEDTFFEVRRIVPKTQEETPPMSFDEEGNPIDPTLGTGGNPGKNPKNPLAKDHNYRSPGEDDDHTKKPSPVQKKTTKVA